MLSFLQMSGLYQSPQNPGGGSTSSTSSQQQYCLKWNNHTNNMVKVFNELLDDENFVDVTLACDGLSIKAHRMVLSACSSYFRDLFINNPCKHPIVILKDIQFEDLRAIIHFMYSGEVNVSYTQLAPLLKTAEALKVKGLTDVNEKHGGAFFAINGNHSEYSNGNSDSPTDTTSAAAAAAVAANLQLYNRMALESITNSNLAEPNPYLAFMTQRLKKRRRKHRNGSALALANILGANGGNFSPLNPSNGYGTKIDSPAKKGVSTANNGTLDASNGNRNHRDEEEENGGASGDESNNNNNKRIKENHNNNELNNGASGGDPSVSLHSPYSTSSGLNNAHAEDEEEEEDEDGNNDTNGDHGDPQLPHESLMMSMNDSDEEFYTDVKPIVSLDESPSPTNSNLDDNSSNFSNSFGGVGILENSLTSNMPNNSTKVCVCHLCHLTFTAYSSLRRHMTRHYADRERYECDICRKSYSRKDYLKEHKKLKHSDVAKVMSAQRSQSKSQSARQSSTTQANTISLDVGGASPDSLHTGR